jgi:hypothetical protein
MQTVQLISITPEQLQDAIINGVKTQLEDFKKHFEPKKPIEYLSRQETADLLKVDLSTIHNYSKRKILQPWGIQGRVYFKRSEVENSIIKLNK